MQYSKTPNFQNHTKEAITEFESKKDTIQDLIKHDFQEAARQLTPLAIDQITRENAAEVIYRSIINEKKSKTRNLENIWTLTSTISPTGIVPVRLVAFPSPPLGLMGVDTWPPSSSDANLGVCFSRSG